MHIRIPSLLTFFYLASFCFSALAVQTYVLPTPDGSYGVGMMNVEVLDASRTWLRSSEKRRFMATAYYPTEKTSQPYSYMAGTLENGIVGSVKVLGHAIPEANPIDGKQFPVVIFLPGRGAERQSYTILHEALASHGYVVIALDQPYVANFVRFPDGTKTTLTLKDLWKLPRDRDYRYDYDDRVIADAIKDIDFLLEHLNVFGGLSTQFDPDRLVLMGHSLGGNIAHIKGFSDRRFKAVVDIDSKITERVIFGKVGVPANALQTPVLFIRGMLQYQEDVGDQLSSIKHSTLWNPKVQHSAFADSAYFAAKIPNYGMDFLASLYNWIFKKGPYFSDTDTFLGDYEIEEWFKAYPQYIIKWLDQTL